MAAEQCPRCKSNNVYYDDGKNACQKCGERWPTKIKTVVIKNNNPLPALSPEPTPQVMDNFEKEREYMKNKLSDLNNVLFAQLERLSEESIKPEKLSGEIERAKAITGVAHEIILNGKLTLDAMVAISEHKIKALPKMMEITQDAGK